MTRDEEHNKVKAWLENNPEKKAKYFDALDKMLMPEIQPLYMTLSAMRLDAEKKPEANQPVGDEKLKALIERAMTESAKIAAIVPQYNPPRKEFSADMIDLIQSDEMRNGRQYTMLELLPDSNSPGAYEKTGILLIAYCLAPFWPALKKHKQEEQPPILKATDTAAALAKQIPTGIVPETILEALTMGKKGLAAIGPVESRVTSNRSKEIKGPSKVDSPNKRTLIQRNEKAGYVASVQIPDIDKLSRGSKALKKWFLFILSEANAATDTEGNLTRYEISFPFQKLVDLGMYSRTDNAKRGFLQFSANRELFNINVTVKSGKETITADDFLFTGTRCVDKAGIGIVVLNPAPHLWPLVMDKYGILPSFYFALDDKAADLLHYVSYLARQNMDKIKAEGIFNIGFRAIQERLYLPSEKGARNPYRDTIGVIESAVAEIEKRQQKEGTELFRFLLIHNQDESITQQLDNGRLQVEACGEIRERYSQLQEKKQKKITASVKKREQGKAARKKQLEQKQATEST